MREEATRDLPNFELFKQLVISSYFVKVKVVLSILADVQFHVQCLKRPVRPKISEDMF